MDVSMPLAGGVEGVRAIRAAGFATKIVMLTVSEDDDDLFDAIRAGANGYLLKNIRPENLFEDLRGVMRGEAPIAPGIAHKLLDALREGPLRPHAAAPREGDVDLTRREAEILQLVAAGLSNKEIAAQLVITEGTVKNHVHNALEKLHLSNRTQAAAYTVAQGLGIPRPGEPERG
jgi:DNA-binding NarL/FixJ family response regulator